MRSITFRILVLAVFFVTAAPLPLRAFDMTGTWVGKWSCKGFDGQKFTSGNKTSTMRVTQSGNTMAVDVDNGDFTYNGGAIPDVVKPEKGEAVFAACPNDNLPLTGDEAETARLSVKTKPGAVKATVKALSIFDSPSGEVGTCKYSYKRVDAADPNVAGCPNGVADARVRAGRARSRRSAGAGVPGR